MPEVSQKVTDAGKLGKPYDIVVHNMGRGSWIEPIAVVSAAFGANVVALLLDTPAMAASVALLSKACAAVYITSAPNAFANFDWPPENLAGTSSTYATVQAANLERQSQEAA
jgi:acyl-CoA synthetase (AMP-forming)/AMP-acid ligase II